MTLISLLTLQLLSTLCHSFRDTCPDKTTSEFCTEYNKCTSCTYWGHDYGCKYCNYESRWYPNEYCYWYCVECQEGWILQETWDGYHYCEEITTTTTPPPNDEECNWKWMREYRNFNWIDKYFSWFMGPSFTLFGHCDRYTDGYYETDGLTSLSLVISDVKIDSQTQSNVNSGQWQFQCNRDGECNDFGQYGGAEAYVNKFDTLNGLDLDVAVFTKDGTATIKDQDVAVKANSLKFGFSVSDAISYSESLEICIDNWVWTWRVGEENNTIEAYGGGYGNSNTKATPTPTGPGLQGTSQPLQYVAPNNNDKTTGFRNDNNGRTIKIGEYKINNDPNAQCVGYDDINVDITTDYERIIIYDSEYFGTHAFGKVTVCYKFPTCESGNILYDPFVYYEGEEEDSKYGDSIIVNCIYVGMVAFMIIYY